jgi:hypothetical protein
MLGIGVLRPSLEIDVMYNYYKIPKRKYIPKILGKKTTAKYLFVSFLRILSGRTLLDQYDTVFECRM